MANDKDFKVKNGIQPTVYHEGVGSVTSGSVTVGYDLASIATQTSQSNVTQLTGEQSFDTGNSGTSLFLVTNNASGDRVYSYTMSTAYDLSTLSATGTFLNIASQENAPNGITLKSDGTSFYIVGSGSDTVFQYDMTTAYDLSTASYSNNYLNTSTYDGGTKCAAISHDGYEVFVPGEQGDDINQFTLSTAWDLSTASYTRTVSHSTQGTNAMAIQFNDDGTIMYLGLETTRGVYQYTLSTAYDISTMSYASKFYSLTQVEGMQISPDGTKLFNCGLDSIIQSHTLSTAWDVSTASSDSITFDVNSQDVDSTGLFFKPDKTKLYVGGKGNDAIYQYDVTSSATATVAWPSTVKWSGATAPDAPASGEKDVYVFVTTDGGTTYYGKQAGDAVA